MLPKTPDWFHSFLCKYLSILLMPITASLYILVLFKEYFTEKYCWIQIQIVRAEGKHADH